MTERKSHRPDLWVLNHIERLNDEMFAYLLLIPVLVVFGVLALWPLGFTFELSLYADSFNQFRGEFVGPQTYLEVFTGERDPFLIRPFIDTSTVTRSILPVTVLMTVGVVAVTTVLGVTAALILDQEFKGRKWIRTIYLLPWAVPVVIQGMIFYLLFVGEVGIGARVLNELGLMSATPLTNSHEAMVIITGAEIWKNVAFVAIITLAGLQSIDRDLYNVAEVSGASRWQRFKTITYPLMMPSVLVSMLFLTIYTMRIYGQVVAISNCSTVPTLTCAVVGAFNSSRYGTSATMAFITAGMIGLIALLYLLKFRDYEVI